MCSKQRLLIEEIICKHHPEFINDKAARELALRMPHNFKVESMVEEALAYRGDMKFIDATGYDFLPDYSDSKTTSINSKTLVGNVGSVETKVGAIRLTVYNPIIEEVAYFFIPKRNLNNLKSPCYGVNSHKERLLFTFNKTRNDYARIEDFRVDNFVELAKAR